MALADRLPEVTPRWCKFQVTVNAMSEEDLATLDEWLATNVSQRVITQAIAAEYPEQAFTPNTLSNHLFARCGCPDGTPRRGIR
jgi:hypothetical protein